MKKKLLQVMLIATMGATLITGCSDGGQQDKEDKSKTDTEVVEQEVKKEPEKVYFTMDDGDIEMLSKKYEEMTTEEIDRLSIIINNTQDIEDDKIRGEVETEVERLQAEQKAQKEKIEEEKRVEKEKEEEEVRLAKEKAEEEERLAKEKEEAEKYNNTVSWDDIARDKEGKSGSYVRFKGKVIQVLQDETISQYRLAIDGDYDKAILIGISNDKLEQNILEDDIITIEGMSLGNTEYTTVMGAKRQIPMVLAENVYTK